MDYEAASFTEDDDENDIEQKEDIQTAHSHISKGNVRAKGEENPWSCSTCGTVYQNKGTFRDHILLRHPEQWNAVKNNFTRHNPPLPTTLVGVTGPKKSNSKGVLKVAYRFKCGDCCSLFIKIEALLLHRHKMNCRPIIMNTKERRMTRVELRYFSGKHAMQNVKKLKDSVVFAILEVPDQGVFFCPVKKCDLRFYSEEDLKGHANLHGKFKCSFCDVVKSYAPNLAEHELTHSKSIKSEAETSKDGGRKRSVWNRKCLRCHRIFGNRLLYISHHLNEHMSLPLITNCCVICNISQDCGRVQYIRHYKLYHDIGGANPESLKKCSVENCQAYFLTLSQLATHQKLRHGASQKEVKDIITRERKSYKCQDCDHSVTTIHYLISHRLKYHSEVGTTCEIQQDLQDDTEHENSSKNMKFLDCPKCSKAFKHKSSLKFHMRSHIKNSGGNDDSNRRGHGVIKGMSIYRFKCPDCSDLFLQLDSLLIHRKKSHQHDNVLEMNASSGNAQSSSEINNVTVEILSFPHKIIPKSLDKAKDFKLFEKIQVVDNIYICHVNTCQRPFHFQDDLKSHSKLHGEFSCHFCKVVKEYAPDLSEHEATHLPQETQQGTANKTTSSWNCPRCKLQFPTKEKYLSHHLICHLNLTLVEENKCAICGLSGTLSRINSLMIRHYKRSHGLSNKAENSFNICKIENCTAYFRTKIQLTHHLKSQHGSVYKDKTVNTRVKCEDCNKTYKDIYGLRNHRRMTHLKTKKLFQCTILKCTVACETDQDLQSHIQYKHSSSKMDFVECPKCNKVINGTGSFQRHMKIHDREEKVAAGLIPKPNYASAHVCETCGKCFSYKTALQIHYLSHSGPESWKFSCDICSKKCMTKQNLAEHMRTHSQEKPFVCQICGQKYAHRFNLRIHINSKHGDVAEDKPRKMNKANFTSRKGIKRKRKEKETTPESECSSESD